MSEQLSIVRKGGSDLAIVRRKSEAATPQPTPDHPHARTARVVGDVLKGGWNVVKEIPGALYNMATDMAPFDEGGNLKAPLGETAAALLQAQGAVGQQAKEAFDRGDYLTATRKGVNYLIPILGPALDASSDKMMQGDVAEGVGEVLTNTALTVGPFAPRSGPVTKPPRLSGPANAREAAAVDFAKQRSVPLDAGTATGSNFVKTVQEKAANTYGGARTAEALQGQQADALARVSGDLMTDAAPAATTPVAAGEGIRTALTKGIQDAHGRANTAYTKVRQGTQGVTMDLAPFKQTLKPIYERLMRENAIAPLQGGKAKALVALDRIMTGPDVELLSVVDASLSDLKALARGAEMPELRNQGQGIAARAVQDLDTRVRATAAQAGADILTALEEGRAATKQKYATADVLDMLSGEPGQVFRQLTQNKDVGLERLKAVQRLAPKELPNIGRAFLEDLFQQATSEGGWAHADRLWANWQKLGAETKRTLFPKQGQIEALDNFFLLQKRLKEVKNPSGTAKMMTATNLLSGLPGWALSKMLMTPQGVRWLTDARVVSQNPSPAATSVAIANITKAAQSAGVPLEAIPAIGEESPTPPAQRTGTRR